MPLGKVLEPRCTKVGNYDIMRNTTGIVDTPPHVQRGNYDIYSMSWFDVVFILFCLCLKFKVAFLLLKILVEFRLNTRELDIIEYREYNS